MQEKEEQTKPKDSRRREFQGFFNICKLANVIHHINKLKNKKDMIEKETRWWSRRRSSHSFL